jgi:hypothetical protein
LKSERAAYSAAKQRCTNPKSGGFGLYGGRGIQFCFRSFQEFYQHIGAKPTPAHSLDRWPNKNGNYEPGNVRWATIKEQLANRNQQKLRRPDVKTSDLVDFYQELWTVPQLVAHFGMSQHAIEKRLIKAGIQLRGRFNRNLQEAI